MKARIKSTGEIVDVKNFGITGEYTNYVSADGKVHHSMLSYYDDFEEIKEIDWEKRRYQIAKDILANFAISNELRVLEAGSKQRVKWAIEEADELIKQLKGE